MSKTYLLQHVIEKQYKYVVIENWINKQGNIYTWDIMKTLKSIVSE